MSFTIEDFHDLIRLLDQRPEWRAELRRQVLTDELLELPALVRQNTEHLDRVEAALERLAEAQARTEARVEQLAEAQARTEGRLDRVEAALERLAEAQARTEARVAELAETQVGMAEVLKGVQEQLARTSQDVSGLKGMNLEDRVRRLAPVYLADVVDGAVTLPPEEVARLLQEAVTAGRLERAGTVDVLRADAIVRGQLGDTGEEIYLVVEASWQVGAEDVRKCIRRARLMAAAGYPSRPVVVGNSIADDAEQAAASAGVQAVISE